MDTVSSSTQLPAFFKTILWSYDFSLLNSDTNKKTIIINTINYGDLSHWRWITQHYGKETIRELLETITTTELRPRARRLASIIFSLKHIHDTPRGTH